VSTNDLEELYYLVEDIKEDIAAQLEERKKEEKEKEEKNKKKETFFTKKFSFGQTVLFAWVASFPLSAVWLFLLWK
jgi:hypothetical protein